MYDFIIDLFGRWFIHMQKGDVWYTYVGGLGEVLTDK